MPEEVRKPTTVRHSHEWVYELLSEAETVDELKPVLYYILGGLSSLDHTIKNMIDTKSIVRDK